MRIWTQQVVAIVALVVFAGFPAATVACTVLCTRDTQVAADEGVSASALHRHHGSAPVAEAPEDGGPEQRISGRQPDCDSHDGAPPQARVALTVARGDASVFVVAESARVALDRRRLAPWPMARSGRLSPVAVSASQSPGVLRV